MTPEPQPTLPAFQFLGIPHITVMILTVVIPVVLAVWVRKKDSPIVTRAVCYCLGSLLLINEIIHWCYRWHEVGPGVFVQKHLPLHVCGVGVFVTAFALIYRNQFIYEIAYFWGLVGTLQAVITPNLEVAFPNYRFFQYFIVHSGIVVSVLFATLGLKMRPTLRSLFRSFFILNLYAVIIGGVNYLLGANYMFLCKTPITASPFFFAPWPWYIPILDGVAFLFFFLVYLPFLISDWTGGNLSVAE